MKSPDVLVRGTDSGEDMVVRYLTDQGTEILGFGMPNINAANTDLDPGPTWCYLILGQKTTLIDTGRFGKIASLKAMFELIGKELSSIDRVIVTHSHEDHDGNLVDTIAASRAEIWAHAIYPSMISYHPQVLDGATHPELPGSCRLCHMPESFSQGCLAYLRARSSLKVDVVVEDEHPHDEDYFDFVFTPGHSPDAICVILENEVLFTGDTLLPDITPHPTTVRSFEVNHQILPERYSHANTVYGLMAYIKSLHKIITFRPQPFPATFPAHRLFYGGRFNLIDNPSERAHEIMQFHRDRCCSILEIIKEKPLTVDEIAVRHFPPSHLAGFGRSLARREIDAHIELMEESGDVTVVGSNRNLIRSSGSQNCVPLIESFLGFER